LRCQGMRQRVALLALLLASACATETSRVVEPGVSDSARSPQHPAIRSIVVAELGNRTGYLRGVFSDGTDRLGIQARTILIGHLQQSGRFAVMDRDHLEATAREAEFAGLDQRLTGAEFAISGDIVEFGRSEVGDRQLWGVLGRGRTQIAYSKVTLNVIDVATTQVVYSVSGAGEYALTTREVVGFGATAGYDATLVGKVLDLSIRVATDRLVEGLEHGRFGTPR
jgi:curli biogenesis system outer membrane secretion channel CsgG